MKVILLEDVKSLGFKGDVVEVSEGYARNFLFPQHMGLEASAGALKEMEQKEKSVISKGKKTEKEEKKLASRLDGFELVLTVKATDGKLYGSVGSKDIQKALKDAGFKIEEDWINFKSTKEVGTTEAVVNFPTGFDATVTVVVEEKSK
ncbi:MAG: 50S ribosomal protein L9 [Candidatus Uhrbacteria bacterium]|nr:50S ribosomal protein L9 [Candidatus Uhrbacteria bacterium]